MLTAIQEERKKTTFNPLKLTHLIYGKDVYDNLLATVAKFQKMHPHDLNIYGKGRVEMMKEAVKSVPVTGASFVPGHQITYLPPAVYDQLQIPGSIHSLMFMPCVKMLGTESQQAEILPKCETFQIIGCYAQTELGHGSDVQGLETTAQFDKNTDQFIINSPSISAAKFWPGDLGLYANYALVFARLILNGNFSGVHSFIVPIRDKDFRLLPGVQAGDIGPKFGYSTKDNGYMLLHNVRIPRKNMLRKYVTVTKEGEIEMRGNPKISYATMMLVRRSIASTFTKQFGIGMMIAGKYAVIRKQFKAENGQEIPIIEYQLQQNKLISCLADFYALSAGALRINKLVDDNFKLVSEKDDDSLMSQTHICLCLSKSYWTDLTLKALETCRLACGGHGYSHYSGLPIVIQGYAPNVTLEGENSVLMMQVARYLLKSFKQTLTKKKALSLSVKYLESFDFFKKRQCAVSEGTPKEWTLQEVRILIAQSVCYFLEKAITTAKQNSSTSTKTAEDKFAAIRLIQAATMHAAYFTFNSFEQLAIGQSDEILRPILLDLCLLFGINALLARPQGIIESGTVQPHHLKSLQVCKQNLLAKIRPHFMGLIDAIGLPDSTLKSAFVSGTNIYQNLLELAKKNDVNQQVNPGVWIMKKQLTNLRPKL